MPTIPCHPGGDPENELQVQAWIDRALLPYDIQRTTPLKTFHIRPWSCIARCGSSAGDLYFKGCEERFRHEIGVTQLLSERHANCSPVVLAVDLQRGWLLMEDAGLRLREQIQEDNWLDHWKRILTRYAEVQIDLASHTNELLAMGVPDRQLTHLPDQLETILGEYDLLLLGEPGGVTAIQLDQLLGLLPTIRARCDQLQRAKIPYSLNHGDLHDANIFLRGEQYVFTDWGDASLAHPFFSLRTAFVSVENTLGLEENRPIFSSLRYTYLEAWREFDSEDNLVTAFELASQLWSLSSLFAWHHSLGVLPPQDRGEDQEAIPALLIELLEANSG